MSDQNLRTRSDRHRRQLYEVLGREDLSLPAKRDRALEIGREFLGVENGHVERVLEDGDTHEVVASVGDEDLVPPGERIDQSKTFCRRTLDREGALAVSDADAGEWADDPAPAARGYSCYLGAPIEVDGEPYGTVCFVSADPREEAFDAAERSFVELLARSLGREREVTRRERRLRERERELDARERALDRSERKYESLLQAAPDAVFLAEADTGEVVEVNEAAADLTGYDRQRLAGMNVEDLHPPEETDRYRDLARRVAEGEAAVTNQPRAAFDDGTPLAIVREDGSRVPIEMSITSLTLDGEDYAQAIVRDVSDRRERERELRVRDRAMEMASVGITIADATEPDLPLVYANPAFADLTGLDRESALGRNCRFLQGPDTDPGTVDEIRAALAAERPVRTEIRNYRPDGTQFWNDLSIAPVTDADGETTHFVGFQRDVTERKRRRRLITALNRVLRHNLRNKTNVVIGHAAMLSDRTGEDDLIDPIERAATDLAALGDKVHALERAVQDDADSRVEDVVPAVEGAVADCRAGDHDVAISLEAPDGIRAVVPPQLRLAVRELIENGIEHGTTAPGGGDAVEVAVDCEEGCVGISVSDDGPGLPENEQAVLRRGYETALEHGSGLGLALVAWIVTGAGGHVSSSVDDGTTVTIHLRDGDATGEESPHRRDDDAD